MICSDETYLNQLTFSKEFMLVNISFKEGENLNGDQENMIKTIKIIFTNLLNYLFKEIAS